MTSATYKQFDAYRAVVEERLRIVSQNSRLRMAGRWAEQMSLPDLPPEPHPYGILNEAGTYVGAVYGVTRDAAVAEFCDIALHCCGFSQEQVDRITEGKLPERWSIERWIPTA